MKAEKIKWIQASDGQSSLLLQLLWPLESVFGAERSEVNFNSTSLPLSLLCCSSLGEKWHHKLFQPQLKAEVPDQWEDLIGTWRGEESTEENGSCQEGCAGGIPFPGAGRVTLGQNRLYTYIHIYRTGYSVFNNTQYLLATRTQNTSHRTYPLAVWFPSHVLGLFHADLLRGSRHWVRSTTRVDPRPLGKGILTWQTREERFGALPSLWYLFQPLFSEFRAQRMCTRGSVDVFQ